MNRVACVVFILSVRLLAEGETVFDESFNGSMRSEWRWLDKDDNSWNLNDGRLNMKRYGGHGFFSADNNRVPVLYVPDVPLENGAYVQVKAGFDVDREYGQAGLIVFYDNDTYVKFVLEYWWSSGLHVIFLQEINTVKQNGNVISGNDNQTYSTISIEMKLAFEHGNIRSWYRRIGDSGWTEECVSAPLPDRGPVNIGLFSQADMGSNDWAWFDDFSLHMPDDKPVSTEPASGKQCRLSVPGCEAAVSWDLLGRYIPASLPAHAVGVAVVGESRAEVGARIRSME